MIVCGVANTVGSKLIVSAPPWALASRIAWRSEPGPLSPVLLTTEAGQERPVLHHLQAGPEPEDRPR